MSKQSLAKHLRLFLISLLLTPYLQAQTGADITGTVFDSHAGQVLSNVTVRITGSGYVTRSDGAGNFQLSDIPPGDYVLQASTVGYRTVNSHLHVVAGEVNQLQLVLTPDAFRRVDRASVQAGSAFDLPGNDSSGEFSISGNDVKNLGTVLADDPLRAVQAMPGVTSNNDFEARFSIRGANPGQIGVYLDGIQLHQTVHTVPGTATSGSNSIFNTDLIQEVSLYDGTIPARFGNSSAAALDVHMRDGSKDAYGFRITANLAYAGVMAEGPLGRYNRCAWISGFRKSYLQYILQNTLSDPTMSFGFQDVQGRMTCRVTPGNTLTLDLIESGTGLDLSSQKASLGPNALMDSRQKTTVVNLGWQYVINDNLLVTSHAGWTRDNFNNTNLIPAPLGSGNYREWVGNSQASWLWNSKDPLQVGVSVRSMRDSGYLTQYNSLVRTQVLNRYSGTGLLAGAFLQQGWTIANGHLHLTAGGRWDRHSLDTVSTFVPQLGLTFSPWSSTQFQLGFGQFAQFPEVAQFTSTLGGTRLLPIRTTQATAAVEQRIATRLRLRATLYNRQDRDLLYQPFLNVRLVGSSVLAPAANPLFTNSLRAYSRGVELLLQRVSVNGLTGWASYTYGRAQGHDGVVGDSFPSDYDQRHTVNTYASYRLRPSVNLSARWTYGSGYPVPAYVQFKQPYSYPWAYVYALGSERNRLRVGSYQRLDLRMNKSWTHRQWKTTLYAEVVNLLNSTNFRYDNFEAYDARQRLAYITLNQMFPILPSAGVVFER